MQGLYALVLLTIFGGGFSKKFTEDMFTPADKTCLKELGLSPTVIINSLDENYISVEGNADINKFTECSFKKTGVIDENDFLIETDYLIEFISQVNSEIRDVEKVAHAAFGACKDIAGEDLGDRAVKFSNCVINFVTDV